MKTSEIGAVVGDVRSWDPRRQGSGMINYVDLSSVNQQAKEIVDPTVISASDAPSRARQIITTGDVLVSTVRPNLNAVAQVPPALDGATASTGFCVLRPRSEKLDGRYLFHWVRTREFIATMVRRATGASYPAVTDRIVKSSPIPLPPIDEQRRIAVILDAVDALRAKRRQALAKLDSLTQAIFIDMFGDPLSGKAPVSTLADIAQFVGGGTPSKARPDYFEGDICWATSKDMKGRFLDNTQDHITEEALASSATKLVPPGSVLVVVKSKVLAHSLPVAIARVPTCFGQDLKGLIPRRGVSAEYLAGAVRAGERWLLARARGVNTEGLTLDELRRLPVPEVNPLEIERFSDLARTIESGRPRSMASLRELDAMFSSLQLRAFRGLL